LACLVTLLLLASVTAGSPFVEVVVALFTCLEEEEFVADSSLTASSAGSLPDHQRPRSSIH
jgi:hypothetical protein